MLKSKDNIITKEKSSPLIKTAKIQKIPRKKKELEISSLACSGEGVGEAVVINGVEGEQVVEELLPLLLAAEEGVTFVERAQKLMVR